MTEFSSNEPSAKTLIDMYPNIDEHLNYVYEQASLSRAKRVGFAVLNVFAMIGESYYPTGFYLRRRDNL